MMIVMQDAASEDQIAHIIQRIEDAGAKAHVVRG